MLEFNGLGKVYIRIYVYIYIDRYTHTYLLFIAYLLVYVFRFILRCEGCVTSLGKDAIARGISAVLAS